MNAKIATASDVSSHTLSSLMSAPPAPSPVAVSIGRWLKTKRTLKLSAKIIAAVIAIAGVAALANSQWSMAGNSCMVAALASVFTWVKMG